MKLSLELLPSYLELLQLCQGVLFLHRREQLPHLVEHLLSFVSKTSLLRLLGASAGAPYTFSPISFPIMWLQNAWFLLDCDLDLKVVPTR